MLKSALIIIYIFANWLYIPLSRRPVKYYFKIKFDNKIPLVPESVIFYLSYFLLFVGGGLTLIFSSEFVDFAKAMIIAQITAVTFWYFFPNGVKRPAAAGGGWAKDWLRRLYRFDIHDGNGAPSAHTYHALIVGHFLARMFPQVAGLIYAWAGLIVVSTVLTKQHYIWDVAGGIMLALISLKL